MSAIGFHVLPHRGIARAIALPGAGQADVALVALCHHNQRGASAVGHVMPEQAACLVHVLWPGQHEAGGVPDLAVLVLAEFDILNQRVQRVARIQFAECPSRQLFVFDGLPGGTGQRLLLIDHDAGHPRLYGCGQRCRQPGCGQNADESCEVPPG
ncbi:MAG TPA: hypothetical protein VF797_03450 [Noviherbaspirillum sp.]